MIYSTNYFSLKETTFIYDTYRESYSEYLHSWSGIKHDYLSSVSNVYFLPKGSQERKNKIVVNCFCVEVSLTCHLVTRFHSILPGWGQNLVSPFWSMCCCHLRVRLPLKKWLRRWLVLQPPSWVQHLLFNVADEGFLKCFDIKCVASCSDRRSDSVNSKNSNTSKWPALICVLRTSMTEV